MTPKLPIYMDNHATTACDPRVFAEMAPYFTEKFGNSSSRSHHFGWQALEGVEVARKQIADLIGAQPKEVIFTSGATESDNLAVKGVAGLHQQGGHIITAITEHKAILDSCKRLEKQGFQITYLPVDSQGLISPDDLKRAITKKTILVTIMLVNNEIGVIQPIAEIGQICQQAGVLFHTDATQGVGKIPFHVDEFNVDLVSLTAHKMYGPKGAGALYVRRKGHRVSLDPMIDGGGQEQGVRSGTLNVTGIVGLGKACEVSGSEMSEEHDRLLRFREKLLAGIRQGLDGVSLSGHPTRRLAGNLNLSFSGVEGESLLMSLRDIAVSSGAACTSDTVVPSHVLKAIGLDDTAAHNSIRFALGRFNTEEEVDYTIARVIEVVTQLRATAYHPESSAVGASSTSD